MMNTNTNTSNSNAKNANGTMSKADSKNTMNLPMQKDPNQKGPLTPHQLAELRKGPRTNIIVGPTGNYFIAIEGAYVNVLSHFSKAARKAFDGGATVFKVPGGFKEPTVWLYKYMMAGEIEPAEQKLASMSSQQLVSLYLHCETIEYDQPKLNIVQHLREQMSITLPRPALLEHMMTCMPFCQDLIVHGLRSILLEVRVMDYSEYETFFGFSDGFTAAMNQSMEASLKNRITAGKRYYTRPMAHKDRASRMSDFIYKSIADGTIHGIKEDQLDQAFQDYEKSLPEMKLKHAKPAAGLKVAGKACYSCHKEGHIARDCPVGKSAKTLREPPKCYNCGELGHIAQDCTHKDRKPSSSRARYHKYNGSIELSDNGESIRTCDREVHPGEKTRLGLEIQDLNFV